MNFKITLNHLDLPKGRENLAIRLASHMKPDKEYIIEIRQVGQKRSLNENKYYWSVVIPVFMKWTGYTKQESHQELARMFLSYEKNSKQFVKSTTDLNTKSFEDYLESCRHFIYMEFNDTIPLPNQLTEEQLEILDKLNRY